MLRENEKALLPRSHRARRFLEQIPLVVRVCEEVAVVFSSVTGKCGRFDGSVNVFEHVFVEIVPIGKDDAGANKQNKTWGK